MSALRTTLPALAVAFGLTWAARGQAAEYYVAPDGDDDAAGSEDAPFETAQRAQQAAAPGDTVYFRGGTYVFSGTTDDIGVLFDKSGSEGNPIRYFAYPDETPIFDFFELTPQARVRGFSVRASWLHFRGLELTGVQQILTDVNESWCIRVENGASNNIFEALDLHHNEGPGRFIADGGNNLVLNVDAHHNWDADRGGENADGFGCHSNDAGNVFRGCRAWYNSDDGFDFINSSGQCTVEYSYAFYNGYEPDTTNAAGNGTGIKAGGFGLDPATFPAVIPRHQVRFNVAFGNRAAGFYSNHHPGGLDWLNNTAFDNSRNFDMLADVGSADHFLRNNLAVSPGTALAQATLEEIDDAFNSWSLAVDVSEADFESLAEEEALAPRAADGSLPAMSFLRLVTGSDLIDAGEDQGAEFAGQAPDLGAFEFGLEQNPPGTGGANNAGSGGTDSSGAGGEENDVGGQSASGGSAGQEPTSGGTPNAAGGETNLGGTGPAPTPTTEPVNPEPNSDPGPTPEGPSETPVTTPTGSETPGPSATPSASPSATSSAPANLSSDSDAEGCGCRLIGVATHRQWGLLSLGALLLLVVRRRSARAIG